MSQNSNSLSHRSFEVLLICISHKFLFGRDFINVGDGEEKEMIEVRRLQIIEGDDTS